MINEHISRFNIMRNKIKFPQTKMLRKKVKTYNDDRYVLWLVPEFVCTQNEQVLDCELLLSYKNRKKAYIPVDITTPYANKGICHASEILSDKRKRMYGVPLIENTLEDLQKIEYISITWLTAMTLDSGAVTYYLNNYVYYPELKSDIGSRIYTMKFEEKTFYKENEENFNYMSEFVGITVYESENFEPCNKTKEYAIRVVDADQSIGCRWKKEEDREVAIHLIENKHLEMDEEFKLAYEKKYVKIIEYTAIERVRAHDIGKFIPKDTCGFAR